MELVSESARRQTWQPQNKLNSRHRFLRFGRIFDECAPTSRIECYSRSFTLSLRFCVHKCRPFIGWRPERLTDRFGSCNGPKLVPAQKGRSRSTFLIRCAVDWVIYHRTGVNKKKTVLHRSDSWGGLHNAFHLRGVCSQIRPARGKLAAAGHRLLGHR